MEFKFNVNNILGNEISKIDSKLRPFRNNHASETYQSQLCEVIDEMGLASAKAQGLSGAITGASRLSMSSHHLYIMKDENGATSGMGSVVGILKVGHKKLFIYESQGNQHEMEPLCILDFYVHESKQRLGCGKKLFEFMLKEERVQKPAHLAIDRPSSKFANFLSRHYGLKAPIPQVNNFVVFEGFFNNQSAVSSNNRRRGTTDQWRHPLDPVPGRKGRGSANSFNREEPKKEVLKNVNPRVANTGVLNEQVRSAEAINCPDSPGHRAMGAQSNMYSRYQEPVTADATVTTNATTASAQATTVSSHAVTATVSAMTASGSAMTASGSAMTASVKATTDAAKAMADATNDVTDAAKSMSPPMLRRDGPSKDYLAMHQYSNYTNRRGHLLVVDSTEPAKDATHLNTAPYVDEIKPSTSWNIFGVPEGSNHSAASRGKSHTRLW